MRLSARALWFGFVSGLVWSIAPGVLAELFSTRANVPVTIVAGAVAGVVTSGLLSLLVARFNCALTVLLGVLSLPLGAFVFGFTFGLIMMLLRMVAGGAGAFTEPWILGANYALLSVVSIFAFGLFPLAVVTTLLLRAFVLRHSRAGNAD